MGIRREFGTQGAPPLDIITPAGALAIGLWKWKDKYVAPRLHASFCNCWPFHRGAALSTNIPIGSPATDDKTKPTMSPIRIPKLPPIAGVTLSGMDFASNASSSNFAAASLSTLPVSHAPLNNSLPNDPFTLPDFEQAMHYLEDRQVSSIKLPLSWESLQVRARQNYNLLLYPTSLTSVVRLLTTIQSIHKRNITRMEVYTDVVATVTSRNASAIVTLSISPEHFSTLTSNATPLPKGGEKESHKNQHKNGHLTQDADVASFVDLWGKLARHFQHDRRVIFHLLAIPKGSTARRSLHREFFFPVLPKSWNQTVQAAVTNIRKSGARNVIILPSFVAPNVPTFDSFRDFPKDFARMQHVKNPDGTTDGIVFDLVQVSADLFSNQSLSISTKALRVNVSKIINPVVKLLNEHHRQAIVGTLAASSDPTCTRTLAKFAKQISNVRQVPIYSTHTYPQLADSAFYFFLLPPGNSPFDQVSILHHNQLLIFADRNRRTTRIAPRSQPYVSRVAQFDSSNTVSQHLTILFLYQEELVDQPNFQSVQPFFPKTIQNYSAEKKPNH
ncbi:hypothetical protein VP01_2116g2 [Puccinia sorghi]|uniref:cellulase n=1 Tax=Puccinia sorghi TaxID=27349 RepID=A0A0L6VA14_9BASI|nr:hypothetical protein VP01_2116g2 [Puccinia sorghi]